VRNATLAQKLHFSRGIHPAAARDAVFRERTFALFDSRYTRFSIADYSLYTLAAWRGPPHCGRDAARGARAGAGRHAARFRLPLALRRAVARWFRSARFRSYGPVGEALRVRVTGATVPPTRGRAIQPQQPPRSTQPATLILVPRLCRAV